MVVIIIISTFFVIYFILRNFEKLSALHAVKYFEEYGALGGGKNRIILK